MQSQTRKKCLYWYKSIDLALKGSVPRRRALGLEFFCVLGLGLEPCVLDSTSGDKSNTWRILFWSRWVKEYALTLQASQKWTRPKPNLIPGDLVLVCDIAVYLEVPGLWVESEMFLQTRWAMFVQHGLRLMTRYWCALSLHLCYYLARSHSLFDISSDRCVVYST